jgi:hypothetical protein
MGRSLVQLLIAGSLLASPMGGLHAADDHVSASAKIPPRPSFKKDVAPLLARYCTRCHGGSKPRAQLALDAYKEDAQAAQDVEAWEKVGQNLRAHEMPPPGRTQPKEAEVKVLLAWVESVSGKNTDHCTGQHDPGRVTLRRLNRSEYNNTIRDLVGLNFQPAEDFPADDVGYGFDNIGDVLSLPPLLMEKYLAAAERVVTLAFADPQLRRHIVSSVPADRDHEDECARRLLEPFMRRAYRRPVTEGEVGRLVGLVRLARSQGDTFDKGMQLALQAILTSPHFLFRVERDRRPNNPAAVHRVSDFELASRLSFFLWSSMPDEELFKLAQQGQLHKGGVLEAQVHRMLVDARARSFVENFAGQWLQLRNLRNLSPDPALFPDFGEDLRGGMQKESEMFFEAVLKENRSILDFLDADFTFLNDRLARHYGIPDVKGDEFRRVSLPQGPRGGLITQASVLSVTSNPTRTSPVKRGKWILENILGTPPPPPPPGVADLSEEKSVVLSGTLRQRMEQHRTNPNCAACHPRMDPLGFALENFDAVGAWRVRDGKFAIDASGALPGGKSFSGPRELKAILISRPQDFCRCLTEKMLTYALGRGMEAYDRCTLDQIVSAVARNNYRLGDLVDEIVRSEPFQMRRGSAEVKK